MDLLRDSSIGQLIRLATGYQYLHYIDELPDFVFPDNTSERDELVDPATTLASDSNTHTGDTCTTQPATRPTHCILDTTSLETSSDLPQTNLITFMGNTTRLEREYAVEAQTTPRSTERPLDEKTSASPDEGIFMVHWFGENDAENPQNWSIGKKALVTFVLWLYTFTVYCASAIYTPSIEGVKDEFHVDHILASLGLSLYVIGYGIGPLIFSPLSEIPKIGRNPPYMITMSLYTLISIPTVHVRSFPAFLFMRFMTGLLGSPCLATGGATLQDMYSPIDLPYGYTAWVGATFCAPALGPVISGFAVATNWRWSMWEVLWMAAFTLLVMLLVFPETSSATILLRRAQRLRKRTGDSRYMSQSEVDEAQLSQIQVVINTLIRPLQITFMDPAVCFTNLYSSFSYGVYYSFFEAFPLVYTDMYGFSVGLTGTAFLSIVVACLVGTLLYLNYVYWYLTPKLVLEGPGLPEKRLVPAMIASMLQPIGLFLFAWTARQNVHWIVSMIGITLFSIGGFVLFQGIFMYLPLSYPRYAASLFAANDFFRSAWAAGAVLYATPLFRKLGVDRGVSLLGSLSCGGVLGVVALYIYGARLRARSKFAESRTDSNLAIKSTYRV